MPRAGLNTSEVVRAGADLADASGIDALSLAALAERLDVKAPALYRHVDGIGDLRRRIATLAMDELGESVGDALRGRSGSDAVGAAFTAVHRYIVDHPGRYAATTGAVFGDDADPLLRSATRLIDSLRAALSAYGLPPDDLDHAIRVLRCLIHGYALLAAADGFQWRNDPAETLTWMIGFIDAGLGGVRS